MKEQICRDYMYQKCNRGASCPYTHDSNLCFYFWKFGECRKGDQCQKRHYYDIPNTIQHNRYGRHKNTVCFIPMTRPVDMRLVYDLGTWIDKCTTPITSRDVVLVPCLFADHQPGELYNILVHELEHCGIDPKQLLKLWHGNDKIEGTHLIADDKTHWKDYCPTFEMIVNRIADFFDMDVKATRFNWYRDTSQWKPFHHDSAAINPEKANVQNFTVAVSFGATREAAFEHADTKTVISLPQQDGAIYAFSKDTNMIWRHGILQDMPVRDVGRISVICWGYIPNMKHI